MITINDFDYELIELLYDNKNSRIYKCSYNNNFYILKCYREKKIQAWINELNVLKDVNGHPNIIQMVDYHKDIEIQNNKYNIIVMEYAEFGDLHEYLIDNIGDITKDDILAIFIQILNGLNHMYKFNWSHRDLKLENILIVNYDPIQIKLIDFEFSTQQIYCKKSMGTISYMSPQLLKKECYNTFKNDVWTLGVILFSLYTNNRPYSEPPFEKKNYKKQWKCQWLSAIESKQWNKYWYSVEYTHTKDNINESLLDNKNQYPIEFKKIIEKMLCWNEKERINLTKLYSDPFLSKFRNKLETKCKCLIL